jgi:hypothetical protein
MRTAPAQLAFSSGEIDPLLHRRADYQRWQTGLATCRGFLPLAQGGFTRAPGTIFHGRTKGDAAAILLPFSFAEDDSVVLEMTPGLLRVWRYGALVMDGAAPYELEVPFGADDLANLRYVQSADVIYLADGARPLQRLERHALDDWHIADFLPDSGPFRVQNLDKAKTLQASDVTGTITLTADFDLFTAAHVGSLIEIKPASDITTLVWVPGVSSMANRTRRYGANYYYLVSRSGDDWGSSPPTHDEGQVRYENDAIWEFLSDGRGVVRITAVTDAQHATADVVRRLPPPLGAEPTYRWAEGAWSEVHGWPSEIELYDQRLAAAATPTEPRTLWFSGVGDFSDWAPSTEADGSFAYAIAGDGSVNRIMQLCRARTGLHILALGEEYSTRAESRAAVIGPTNAVFGLDSAIGAAPIRPIAPAGAPIFVSADRRRVVQIGYSLQSDANEARILSRPAAHLGTGGFEQIVWQGAPEPIAWLRRGTGDLVAMLHDEAEEVLGWAVLPVAGGVVEALAVTPAADGTQDVVTLVVARELDGETVRCVEELAPAFVTLAVDAAAHEACHLFCATRFDLESAVTELSVPHLAGEAVHVWSDLGPMGPLTVAGDGTLKLPARLRAGWVGLFDATHQAQTLDIRAAAPDGESWGRRKRLSNVAIALHRSCAGTAQAIERDFGQPERPFAAALSFGQTPVLAEPVTLKSGWQKLALPTGYATELSVRIRPVGGAPLTVTGLVPRVEESG